MSPFSVLFWTQYGGKGPRKITKVEFWAKLFPLSPFPAQFWTQYGGKGPPEKLQKCGLGPNFLPYQPFSRAAVVLPQSQSTLDE